jgi:hypothetical protein
VCPPFSTSYLYVSLSQNVLGRIASGGASKQVTCTGGFETTTLNIQAQNVAFWPVEAYAKAELSTYPNPATDAREIKLQY